MPRGSQNTLGFLVGRATAYPRPLCSCFLSIGTGIALFWDANLVSYDCWSPTDQAKHSTGYLNWLYAILRHTIRQPARRWRVSPQRSLFRSHRWIRHLAFPPLREIVLFAYIVRFITRADVSSPSHTLTMSTHTGHSRPTPNPSGTHMPSQNQGSRPMVSLPTVYTHHPADQHAGWLHRQWW